LRGDGRGGWSVSRRDDPGVFDHKDYGTLRSARAVQDSLGDNEALSRSEFHGSILQVDQESPLDHIEEFIISVVLVPVIIAFYNPQPHYGLVNLAQRLVVPLVRAGVGESLLVDHF